MKQLKKLCSNPCTAAEEIIVTELSETMSKLVSEQDGFHWNKMMCQSMSLNTAP